MTKKPLMDRIEAFADDWIKREEIQTRHFNESVAKNGLAYSLSWSRELFGIAAKGVVARTLVEQCKHAREHGEGDMDDRAKKIVDFYGFEVIRKGQYINNHSTSITSNYMDQCTLAAQAEFVDKFTVRTYF